MTISTGGLPTREFLHSGNTRLSYTIAGEGPPVVFIQGVGLHGDGWLPQTEALSAELRCLTFDNPGMGRSLPSPDDLSVPALSRAVLDLMDHLDWPAAHLVGHSLGSLVALETAAVAPSRVRSLASLCSVVRGRDATRVTWPVVQLGLATRLGTKRAARHAFLRLTMSRSALAQADMDALAAQLEALFGHDLAEQPPVVDLQLRALRAYDASPRLEAVRSVPSLVVSASQDPIAPPRYGRRLAQLLGARFELIEDAAHGVTINHAQQVNELLLDHIRKVEKRAEGHAAII